MKKILIVIITLITLTCCSLLLRIIEVPVNTIEKEYIYNTTIDSILVKDSIDRWRSGDTVFIYKEHTKLKYLIKNDTIIRVDTILTVVPIETVKIKEVNKLKWWQTMFIWIGGVSFLWVILYIIYKIKFK